MRLVFEPVSGVNKNLLPECVYNFISHFDDSQAIKAAEIDPSFADGDLLSKKYDIPYEMEVNCLVVEGRRGEDRRYAALLVPYGKRVNTNAVVKRHLDAAKVSFADIEYVTEAIGMEFGSIMPIGLPKDWLILADKSLLEQKYLVVGGGLVKSKLLLASHLLAGLPNVNILDGLAKD